MQEPAFSPLPTKFSTPSKTNIISLATYILLTPNAFILSSSKFCHLVKSLKK